jgi:hypothetical protein
MHYSCLPAPRDGIDETFSADFAMLDDRCIAWRRRSTRPPDLMGCCYTPSAQCLHLRPRPLHECGDRRSRAAGVPEKTQHLEYFSSPSSPNTRTIPSPAPDRWPQLCRAGRQDRDRCAGPERYPYRREMLGRDLRCLQMPPDRRARSSIAISSCPRPSEQDAIILCQSRAADPGGEITIDLP